MAVNKKKFTLVGFCLLIIGTTSNFAGAVSLTVPTTSNNGVIDLSWSGNTRERILKEDGIEIYRGYKNSTTIIKNEPGSYTYQVYSCTYVSYGGFGSHTRCGWSAEKTVNVVFPEPPPAISESITVSDINDFIQQSLDSGDDLGLLIGNEIQHRLEQYQIKIDEDGLIYRHDFEPRQLRGGCSANARLTNGHAIVQLNPESSFKLQVSALAEPIVASVRLLGNLDAYGKVKWSLGFKFLGKCIKYDKGKVSGNFNADFVMTAVLSVNLNPELSSDNPNGDYVVRLDPQVTLTGEIESLTNVNANFSISSSGLTGFLNVLSGGILFNAIEGYVEDAVESTVDTAFANNEFQKALAKEQAKLREDVWEAIPPGSTYTVSAQNAEIVDQMLGFVRDVELDFPVAEEYLRDHKREVLYSLLVGDVENVRDTLGTAAACQALADLDVSRDMPTAPRPSDYISTSMADFCAVAGDKEKLGNPVSWDNNGQISERPWTLMPSTTFDISSDVASIRNNHQPYMKQVRYKSVDAIDSYERVKKCVSAGPAGTVCWYENKTIYRGDGECKLEMRIYKKDAAATNLKPLMAIHGGSWRFRGFGFFGMESMISHFTERGFVVFAPFFRLTGETDGNIECNGATGQQTISDINDALSWVENNKSRFGASGKVRLFGQSSGAHLAGWLSVNHPGLIQKSLLMYPPTDMADYIDQLDEIVVDEAGIGALKGFLSGILDEDEDLFSISLANSFILENSFPGIVAGNPSLYPPMFMLHGNADMLVPSRQSVRLCNALSGNPSSGPAVDDGGNPSAGQYKRTYDCDSRGSKLHLFAEADHILDLCPVAGFVCQAGSGNSAEAVKASLQEAWDWLEN